MLSKVEILSAMRAHKAEINRFGVRSMGLFGSVARGDATQDSDVDILVDLEKPLGWEIVDLREFLRDLLGRKVDLVTLGAVSKKVILWKSIQEDLINV